MLMAFGASDHAQAADSPRIALVIGIGAYKSSPLPTAANDAGMVAQTLVAAGFDVTGARDLDGASLRRTIHDFIDKASAGGPRGVAMVYLAGHALQVDGENYFAPVDADLDHTTGAAIEMVRIADLTHTLASTDLGAKLVVIDGAHAGPNAVGTLAQGLALVEAEQGTLLAFNTAPGAVAPIEPAPFGTYAKLLTQNMKQGGVPADELFDRLRVAVNTATGGSVTPWDSSKLLQPFTFFDRAANAPAMGSAQVPFTSLRTRPLRDFSPEQAYDVAVARDTLASYQDYLAVFADHPLSRRIRQILALRREALFWRDVVRANSPPAYWTYLKRYPDAPHGADARRRLARLAAGTAPPLGFALLAFDVPPPAEDEIRLLDRRGLVVEVDLPPPPLPPLFLLPSLPADADATRPPPPPPGPRLLPVPLAVAIPFVRPIIAPGMISPPHGISGGYRQPRPFAAASSDGGLVPQRVDDVAPIVEPVAPKAPLLPQAPVAPVVPVTAVPAFEPPPAKMPPSMTPPSESPEASKAHGPPLHQSPVALPPKLPSEPVPPDAAPRVGTKPAPHKPQAPTAPSPPIAPSAGGQPLPIPMASAAGKPPGVHKPKIPPAEAAVPASVPTLPTHPHPVAPVPKPAEISPVQAKPASAPAARLPAADLPHRPAGEASPKGVRRDCGHPDQPPCHP